MICPPAPVQSGIPGHAPPEQSFPPDQQVDIRQKRYAHLPLIADELRKPAEPQSRQYAPEIPEMPGKKSPGSQKKGVLGFLKK